MLINSLSNCTENVQSIYHKVDDIQDTMFTCPPDVQNYQTGEDLRKWYSGNGVSIVAIGIQGRSFLLIRWSF